MEPITIKNEKIIHFYSTNPSIDFEAVNLIFIDLFQKLFDDMNSTMNSAINSQILSNVGEIKTDIISLQNSVSNLNDDFSKSIYIRFQESKKEYIDDIKNIIQNNFSQNSEKITSQLVDKTSLLLNDIIPKNNNLNNTIVENNMQTFHKNILQEINSILNSNNREKSMENFIQSFDQKSSIMLQPLFSYINACEERLQQNVNSIKNASQQSVQEKIMEELSEFLGKYKNSSYKGQFGENKLDNVLNSMFPSAEIINTTGTKASCDFKVNRNNFSTILFENKDYERNVSLDEVKKFIRDIEEQKNHGIFLSQHSGISSKQNYQIDIKGPYILVYIHNVEYCPYKIQIAVDIIDSLSNKLNGLTSEEETISISKDYLDEINKEYANFITHKSSLIDLLKDFQKKMLSQLDEIKFPSLSKFLTQQYGSILNDENEFIICNICNSFQASSNKSLSAHQRGCKRKFCKPVEEIITINTTQ
jgi:hypothetical protein